MKNNSVVENGHRISEYDATCIRKLDIFVADDRLRRWRQRVVERKQKKSLKRKFSDEIGDNKIFLILSSYQKKTIKLGKKLFMRNKTMY